MPIYIIEELAKALKYMSQEYWGSRKYIIPETYDDKVLAVAGKFLRSKTPTHSRDFGEQANKVRAASGS